MTPSIDIDGRGFAWRVEGSGPALVLVNGYAATRMDWDPTFVAALADSFELLCPTTAAGRVRARGPGR